jgi:hypothetical protein
MDDASRSRGLQALADELRTIDMDATYFAATLLGTEKGWSLSFQTWFVGWPDGGGPHKGVELREAAPVHPDRMARMWEDLGQSWVVVKKPLHLALFLRMGGNALIDADLARKHLRSHVERREVVPLGAIGFVNYDPESYEVARHRPTPKQRLRVLERNGYRCQLCGGCPSENEHVVLIVHHIRLFGRGGLTADENLITLCHTCHDGLEPHEKLTLFFLPGGHLDRAVERETPAAFQEGVTTYRRLIAPIVTGLNRGRPRRRGSLDRTSGS